MRLSTHHLASHMMQRSTQSSCPQPIILRHRGNIMIGRVRTTSTIVTPQEVRVVANNHVTLPAITEDELVRALYSGTITPEFLTGARPTVLVQAASRALSTDEVPDIVYEDDGGYNRLFLLHFPKAGKKVVARVAMKDARFPCRIAPAVATMSFARHVLGIPVPQVYAWNASDDNPVGAPYILQEYIEEVVEPWKIFSPNDTEEQQALALDELARWHHRLLTPLPAHLNGVGDLAFAPDVDPVTADLADPSTYVLEPLLTKLSRQPHAERKVYKASSTSLPSLWDELCTLRYNMSLSRSGAAEPDIDREELYMDEAWLEDEDRHCTFTSFSTVAHHARTFVQNTLSRFQSSPVQYTASCLVRNDYAFRNVLLDPSSLRVKAFIDWDDVHVTPLPFAVTFPEDFMISMLEGMSPDAPYFKEGEFPCLPPDEHGDIIGPIDKDGKFTNVDADGNRTYIDERDERIRHTMWREAYAQALGKYDERVRDEEFWALRKDLLKAQTLIKYGGRDWWRRRKWLAAQFQEGKSHA